MEILQLLIFGIVVGSITALGAIGVSLTFGILRFANFSAGDLMTLGAYFAFVFFVALRLPMPLSFVLACIATAVAAVFIDRSVYRFLRRSPPVILLISSFGMALILRSIVQIVWGPSNLVYESGIQMPLVVAGLRIKLDQLYIIGGTAVLVVALHFFLQRTKTGKAMRAMSDNIDLARITGIDTERVVLWTWVIAGIMAAAAGIFLGIDTRLHPVMGFRLLLPVFAAAILGGIGKPYGAVVGGLVIGIAQEMSTLFLAPPYKDAVAFALLVIMLIFRPQGLFGGRVL
ncbi:MAG: branched-chain amino acid ABC transporter permease [Gammaproteobacteria bacterium]|nr:branched-chain amino acid ABC transporter permease [Gammaproteobacteria bacterium]NIR85398.1 branched-chain amino acid ABC transporter permease [Gammaproteobacteria bacterium]NIR88916.1 branched-chain amino acid ABC transporter permease [Gammaproteobacteria bacterium]NIU06524.1 branched-chain amino acid ABC transporter permease [Gammaproteobacteria bacterium]NIV53417.1 branched-chain amino acid ABC transporter permease [Gammaproteobacteria bacterium]